MMTGDELAANFIVNARWETLPDAVKQKIRMCLVDSVVATLANRDSTPRHSQIWRHCKGDRFVHRALLKSLAKQFAQLEAIR